MPSWVTPCSGRFSLSKSWQGDNAFMWDGSIGCDGRSAALATSHMHAHSPSHAMLQSTSPNRLPLPEQRSVDPRLATSAAANRAESISAHGKPGPGSYEARASSFGKERAYVAVQRPASPHAVGLPKGVSGRLVVAALVKKCAACYQASLIVLRWLQMLSVL